jgi:hypothetical protein
LVVDAVGEKSVSRCWSAAINTTLGLLVSHMQDFHQESLPKDKKERLKEKERNTRQTNEVNEKGWV